MNRKTVMYADLVCLNGTVGMDLDLQIELFEAALDALDLDGDLVNQVLEITLARASDTEFAIIRYALPADRDGSSSERPAARIRK